MVNLIRAEPILIRVTSAGGISNLDQYLEQVRVSGRSVYYPPAIASPSIRLSTKLSLRALAAGNKRRRYKLET